jgi:multidrug efflux pump subunit AcrA (membrane-fusion protein)
MIFFRKPASTFRDHALMMRKLVWWAFPVVIAASALALPMGDAIAQQGSADRAVSVTPSRRMCFSDTLQVAGVVVPRNEVLVRPDREGLQIAQVLVEPGDTVVGGQVLARLIALDGQPAGQGVAVQAPAGGIVISAAAVIGAPASARGEPLFRIAARGELELLADAPVQSLASLAAKQSAKIDVVGIGELQGEVRAISTAIDPVTQSGQVRLILGSDPRLRVGTFGRARIEIAQRCNTAVPLSAVLYGSGGTLVQVVRDGRVETRSVSVGLMAGGQAEIREGLNEGEMVVARAGVFVREGDRVRAIPVDAPAGRP